MITPIELNEPQLMDLSWRIEEDLRNCGVAAFGVEVTNVQDEEDMYKAFYVYEKAGDMLERHGSLYFNATLVGNVWSDFRPVYFGAI